MLKSSTKIITLAVATFFAIFAFGCSKTPGPKATQLGAIELSPNTPRQLDLGDRKECVLAATDVTNDTFQLTLTFNARSFSGVIDKEQTKTTRLTAHFGQKCAAVVGDVPIEFTPVLKAD